MIINIFFINPVFETRKHQKPDDEHWTTWLELMPARSSLGICHGLIGSFPYVPITHDGSMVLIYIYI